MTTESAADLERAFAAVGELIAEIGPEQWAASTPCSEWAVRDVVAHLVGLNRVFVAMMGAGPMPDPGQDHLGDDPLAAYRDSAAALTAVFGDPGMLEKTFTSPLGSTTGEIRLRIRIADLLTHGWDLQRATGIRTGLPEDLVEQSLAIVQEQMVGQSRAGRFDDPQPVADDAPPIERLAAFTGRKV